MNRCSIAPFGSLFTVLVASLVACRAGTPATDAAQPIATAPGSALASSGGGPRDASARPHWDGTGTFRLYATDFHFELGGTQILAVDETGHVRDLFVRHEIVPIRTYCADAGPDRVDACRELVKSGQKDVGTHRWFLAEYTLSADALGAFRKTLVAADLASLEPSYTGSAGEDGTTHGYFLVTREGRVVVSAYSTTKPAEPPRLSAVRAFLLDQQKAHEDARARAPEASAAAMAALLVEVEGKPTP
jgi:hypothetical protein